MFKRSAMLVPLTIALTCAACQPVGPLTEEDIAAIGSLGAALDEAALASDWGALATLHDAGISHGSIDSMHIWRLKVLEP